MGTYNTKTKGSGLMDKYGICPVCGKESVLVPVLVSQGNRGKVVHMCSVCLRDVKKGLLQSQDVNDMLYRGRKDDEHED